MSCQCIYGSGSTAYIGCAEQDRDGLQQALTAFQEVTLADLSYCLASLTAHAIILCTALISQGNVTCMHLEAQSQCLITSRVTDSWKGVRRNTYHHCSRKQPQAVAQGNTTGGASQITAFHGIMPRDALMKCAMAREHACCDLGIGCPFGRYSIACVAAYTRPCLLGCCTDHSINVPGHAGQFLQSCMDY